MEGVNRVRAVSVTQTAYRMSWDCRTVGSDWRSNVNVCDSEQEAGQNERQCRRRGATSDSSDQNGVQQRNSQGCESLQKVGGTTRLGVVLRILECV